MLRRICNTPLKGVVLFLTALLFSNTTLANTHVITADINNVEPIYMNYTIKKVAIPCKTRAPGCYKVSYKKKVDRVLKGYRVKLAYGNKIFTTRMLSKPTSDKLKIRVRSDLLNQPSAVAINAAVVYY